MERFTVTMDNGKMAPLQVTDNKTIMSKECTKETFKKGKKMEREFIPGTKEEVNIKETSKTG